MILTSFWPHIATSSQLHTTNNNRTELVALLPHAKVLPRHGVVPEEDIYYYRILLRLSLDPEPDWWAKYDKEVQAAQAR